MLIATGESLHRENANFSVVILDRKGAISFEQVTKREPSRFLHMDDNPLAAGLLFDSSNDRMIVRVHDPDVNRGIEKWWVYRLSTAKPAGTFEPQSLMPDSDRHLSLLRAQLIPGTTLTLLHWWTVRFDKTITELGARFTLIDVEGKPVWTRNLPRDYTRPKDEKAEDNLREEIWKSGAILNVTPASEFTLRFAAENKRVTFAVQKGADRVWNVKETARQQYLPQAAKAEHLAELPKLSLKPAGVVSLRSLQSKPTGPIRNIREFVVDGKGRLAFIRNEENPYGFTFVLVTATGELVREIPLKVEQRSKDDWPSTHLVWVGGDRFLHTQSSSGIDAVAKAWWIDIGNGQVTPVEGFKCPSIRRIAGFPDGRFVALATIRSKYTMMTTAYLFDAKGKLIHTFREGYEGGPASLFSTEDIAVTSDGTIVVLDVIRANISLFAGNGDYRKTVDLTQAWKRKPNYASYLAADVDGGFIVGDFGGHFPVIRMRSDGSVLKEFAAKYSDGKTTETMQHVQVDQKGKLWATDGKALIRLDKNGVAEHVLGNPPDLDQLGEIAALAVDSRGRIYVVDSRTSAVHVLDSDGKPLHICKPNPNDFTRGRWDVELSVADTGDVYLGFLHFSPDGKRLGFEMPPETDEHSVTLTKKWIPRPKGTGYWIIDYQSLRMTDEKRRVMKIIERGCDGRWLEPLQQCIMAPDGSLAVLEGSIFSGSGQKRMHRYDPTGKPQQTFGLTLSGEFFCHYDYDGETFVFRRGNQMLFATATGHFYSVLDTPENSKKDLVWTPFLLSKQKQLWLFDGVDTIHRFSLP